MYVGKRYPFLKTIQWSKHYILLFLLIDAIPAIAFYFTKQDWLILPWQPISLIGIAVAFYLGFKNNSSYERLWEARKIWGGIVNASRTFTVNSRDFISNQFVTEGKTEQELHTIHKRIVHRHVAWMFALTYQLRERREWEHNKEKDDQMRKQLGLLPEDDHFSKLKEYLSEEEFSYIMGKGNKASHILSLQSKEFKALREQHLIDDFRHIQLSKSIEEFYVLQGKSERIKNFPFPRQYASVNFFFVWIFIIMLPFGMLSIFGGSINSLHYWLIIPVTTLVSWVFIIMEMIGDYSENPFEGLFNDVPITSMARGIEIDIRQMLEESEIPGPVKPGTQFNLLY